MNVIVYINLLYKRPFYITFFVETLFLQFSGLIIIGLATEVWSHVEIEAEDYFFPLEPVKYF